MMFLTCDQILVVETVYLEKTTLKVTYFTSVETRYNN